MNSNSETSTVALRLASQEKSKGVETTAMPIPWRRVGIYVVLALSFFLLGALPTWFRAQEAATQRDLVQRELAISRMQNQLSEIAIMARRGEYEPARQTASDFFTALRNQIDHGQDSTLSTTQRAELSGLLAQRDDIIMLLARSDPAAAGRLSDFYVHYRRVTTALQPQKSNGK
jgi:hypothetical protein